MPHDYVIPQAMPHAIPQTHSAFYPHRCDSYYQTTNKRKNYNPKVQINMDKLKICFMWTVHELPLSNFNYP